MSDLYTATLRALNAKQAYDKVMMASARALVADKPPVATRARDAAREDYMLAATALGRAYLDKVITELSK
jgi:hypothetical protein